MRTLRFPTVFRRDYSQPRRMFALQWYESVVPYFRAIDERRFVRNFRIPSILMDEIVSLAEQDPEFAIAARGLRYAESTAKKVHIAMWRLGRAASVSDCCEAFGVYSARGSLQTLRSL